MLYIKYKNEKELLKTSSSLENKSFFWISKIPNYLKSNKCENMYIQIN